MSKTPNQKNRESDPWESLEAELFGVSEGKEHLPAPVPASSVPVAPLESASEESLGFDDEPEEALPVPSPRRESTERAPAAASSSDQTGADARRAAAVEPEADEAPAASPAEVPAADDFWNALGGWDLSQSSSSESSEAPSDRGGGRGRGRSDDRSGRDRGGRDRGRSSSGRDSGSRDSSSRERTPRVDAPRAEAPRSDAPRSEAPRRDTASRDRDEPVVRAERDVETTREGRSPGRDSGRDAGRGERGRRPRAAEPAREVSRPAPVDEDPWGDELMDEVTPTAAASADAGSADTGDVGEGGAESGDPRRRRRRRGRGGRRGGREDVRDEATPSEVDGDFDDAVADVSSEDVEDDCEDEAPEPVRGRRDRGGRRGAGRPAVRSEFADEEETLEPDDFETVSVSEQDDEEDDEDDDPVDPGSWGPVPTWEEAIEFLLRPDLVEIDPASPGGQSARGSTSDGARSATRHYGPRK
jgi:ribonuclease E